MIFVGLAGKDPLLPRLQIYDLSVPADRQQCVLQATQEAKQALRSGSVLKQSDVMLRNPETAIEEGKLYMQLIQITLCLNSF